MTRCRFVAYWAKAQEALPAVLSDAPPPHDWHRIICSGRFAIFCNRRDLVVELPRHQGIVLGEIHSREESPQPGGWAVNLSRHRKEDVAPDILLSAIWGRYVAFLIGPDDLRVLRDPSGGLSCYFSRLKNGSVFASDARLLVATSGTRPCIDRDGLLHHLLYGSLPVERTALTGIMEILPGFVGQWKPGERSTTVSWNPWRWGSGWNRSEPMELASQLRETIERSISVMRRSSRHVLLTVSGGLDSSIVAACLAVTGCVTLLTLATQRAEGDERPYARALARHLGLELVEATFSPERIDLGRTNASHLPRPIGYTYGQVVDQLIGEVSRQRGCDSYFTGNGGDNVFCHLTSVSPVVDRWMAFGLGRGVAATVRDVQALTGASIQSVATHAIRRLIRTARYRWPLDVRFLAIDTELSTPPAHPWLDSPRGAFPGKAAHIALLLKAQLSLENRPDHIPMVTPLLSQPVLETCLSIPSWQWCTGGINRAIARAAFRDALPDAVLSRITKAGPGSFMADIFDQNRSEIRERLHDGALARMRILDMPSIDYHLQQPITIHGQEFRRIMALLDAEAWVQSWAAT